MNRLLLLHFRLAFFPQLLLKIGKALGFVGITTILRTKIKIETQPLFIIGK
jgi:hypothetical protein